MAGRWMGWETSVFCEIDSYCQKLLKQNFPGVPVHDDIHTLTRQKIIEYGWNESNATILTGGFPCQPFSVAGKRKGEDDNRYLWPEMLRVIREIQPDWVVGENVTGIINLALDEVLASLEDEGYKTETFVLPACTLNAPHRRDRVWIVAYANGTQLSLRKQNQQQKNQQKNKGGIYHRIKRFSNNRSSSNPNSKGLEKQQCQPENNGTERQAIERICNQWTNWPTQPPVCGRDDGLSHRVDRIKALGNAIVPQVVYEIFKLINYLYL